MHDWSRYLCLTGVALAAFFSRAAAEEHTKDSLETVKKNLADKKAVLLDVREKSEWDAGHLKDARLAPLGQLKSSGAPADLDKSKIVYCHCKAGRRALAAAEILKQQGYDVRALKQGYEELVAGGLPKAP